MPTTQRSLPEFEPAESTRQIASDRSILAVGDLRRGQGLRSKSSRTLAFLCGKASLSLIATMSALLISLPLSANEATAAPSDSGGSAGQAASAKGAENKASASAAKSDSEGKGDSAQANAEGGAEKPAKKASAPGANLPSRITVSDADRARLEKGEILVVTRKVEGSKVPEAVVHAVIEAAPAQVWPLLDQCNRYVGVMPRITKAKELTRKGFEVRCAMTFSPPWPMSDMNSITLATHRPGPPAWVRAWVLESGDYNSNSGHWLLHEFEGNPQRTLVEYRLHSEPKVSIPGFLQEMGVKSALPDLIKQVREAVAAQASR